MATAGKMYRAQMAIQKATTLAEAQTILEKLRAEEQEIADIFYSQEQMIGTLTERLESQDRELTYVSPIQKPVNYLLLVAVGIGILIFWGKIKL